MKDTKYKVGDIVFLKGEEELFEVIEVYKEKTYSKYDRNSEFCCIAIEGMSSGKVMDTIPESDQEITLIVPASMKQTNGGCENKYLDILLDQYNKYLKIDKLLNSTGVKDVEYKEKANQVMDLITKIFV